MGIYSDSMGYEWEFIVIQWDINGIYPLVVTNTLPWFFDGPNRNRWFTELNSMGIFHGELLNNQMVIITGWW